MALFNWNRKASENKTQTKQQAQRPNKINRQEDLVVNSSLTKGVYHNSYTGLKLGGALAAPPIDVPVAFMGVPIPAADSDVVEERARELIKSKLSQIRQIHTEANREGTLGVWPYFDSERGQLRWEVIVDDSITDVLRDPFTMDVIGFYVEEEITLKTERDTSMTVVKTRLFTEQTIRTTFSANAGIPTEEVVNPIGMLPIIFANNQDSGEFRGHSDYERIIPDLKAYADMYEAMVSDLATFKTKLAQTVGNGNVDTWLKNNGYESLVDIDAYLMDFVINQEGEKTEIITSDRVTAGYLEALKIAFRKIVEGSGVPEIAWGLKTEGNMASVQENMEALARYVDRKREQYTNPWEQLLTASMSLLGIVNMDTATDSTVTVTWDDIDTVSQELQAKIFQQYMDGLSKVMVTAGITPEQVFNLWRKWFPTVTDDDQAKFIAGIRDMALHKGYTAAPHLEQLDAAGLLDDETEPL